MHLEALPAETQCPPVRGRHASSADYDDSPRRAVPANAGTDTVRTVVLATGAEAFSYPGRRGYGSLRWRRRPGEGLRVATLAGYHAAVAFIVGMPCAFAVHSSMPSAVSLALTLNSAPSNSGCT